MVFIYKEQPRVLDILNVGWFFSAMVSSHLAWYDVYIEYKNKIPKNISNWYGASEWKIAQA